MLEAIHNISYFSKPVNISMDIPPSMYDSYPLLFALYCIARIAAAKRHDMEQGGALMADSFESFS